MKSKIDMTTPMFSTSNTEAFNNVLAANKGLLARRLVADEAFLLAQEMTTKLSLSVLKPIDGFPVCVFKAKEDWEKAEHAFWVEIKALEKPGSPTQANPDFLVRKKELDEALAVALRTGASWADSVIQNTKTQTTYNAEAEPGGKQPGWWNQEAVNGFSESILLAELLGRKFIAQRDRYRALLTALRSEFILEAPR